MIEKVRKLLRKLEEILGEKTTLKPPPKRKTMEERRQEALKYLVEKHFEWKKREEDHRKKLESYGKIRRWIYKRSISLKDAGMIIKESIVKPFIMVLLIGSGAFSMWLGTMIGQQITKFTQYYVPSPFNYVLDLFILFPLGFSPCIIGVILSYYIEKRKMKKLLEDYGVTIQFP
jgi:hypothetical protein